MLHARFEKARPQAPFLQWNENVVNLLACVERAGFTETLTAALSENLSFDHVTLHAYRANGSPWDLFHNVRDGRSAILVDEYIRDGFRLDPFTHMVRETRSEGLMALRSIADNLEQTQYYRRFFGRTELGDELGFLVRLDDGVSLILSLLRDADRPHFTCAEREEMSCKEPVIRALLRRHWQAMLARRPGAGASLLPQPAPAAVEAPMPVGIAGALLTPRETDIVRLILKGHGSESIARNLQISIGTVKVHRKHVYRKLRISSQGELFHLCFGQEPAQQI